MCLNRDRGARGHGRDDDGDQTAGAVPALAPVVPAGLFGKAFLLMNEPVRW